MYLNVDLDLWFLVSAEAAERTVKKKVPVGTSEYQAAWIVESDGEDDVSQVSDDDEEQAMQVSARDVTAISLGFQVMTKFICVVFINFHLDTKKAYHCCVTVLSTLSLLDT